MNRNARKPGWTTILKFCIDLSMWLEHSSLDIHIVMNNGKVVLCC